MSYRIGRTRELAAHMERMKAPRLFVQSGSVNAYHPGTSTITLRTDATLYTRFHEIAHARQHQECSPVYLLWYWTRRLPWIRNLTNCVLESDASGRAVRSMRETGSLTTAALDQSDAALATYRRRLWLP